MLYTVLPDKQNAYSLPAQATAFTVISVPSVRSLPSHEGLSIFATQALLLLKLNGAPNLGWICRVVCGLPTEPGQRIFSCRDRPLPMDLMLIGLGVVVVALFVVRTPTQPLAGV